MPLHGVRDGPPAAGGAALVPDPMRWRDLRRELEDIPQHPALAVHPRRWMGRLKRGADFWGHNAVDRARFFARINPYPRPFTHVWFHAEDGVRLAGWLGPRRPTRPTDWGLVVVPGLFSTKDDTVHKSRAIRMWRHWRVPVLAIDLRGFGESMGINTAGWKEALDVRAAAEYLRSRCGVRRVAVLAESLGGAATLNAAGQAGKEGDDLFDGGIITWSAFVDARDAVEYINTRPSPDHPFAASWGAFQHLLGMKTMGGYEQFTEYLDDAARTHGLSGLQELYDIARPKHRVRDITAPTLIVHAVDDPVIPVRHARRMERYAEQDNVQVLVVPWGGHTSFEARDPRWYWKVATSWYGKANGASLVRPRGRTPSLK